MIRRERGGKQLKVNANALGGVRKRSLGKKSAKKHGRGGGGVREIKKKKKKSSPWRKRRGKRKRPQ